MFFFFSFKNKIMLCVSVWALITEYHRLSGLNNRNLLPTVLEAGRFKIKTLANSVSGENPFLGPEMGIFLWVFTWSKVQGNSVGSHV